MKSPKTIKLVTALGAFAVFVILAPLASAQGKQDFTLYNRTGMSITSMYVSPASEDEWGDDILGIDTLASDEDTMIHFSPRERVAAWDYGRPGAWREMLQEFDLLVAPRGGEYLPEPAELALIA